MVDEYGSLIASHYTAYRPPLHKLILEKCIQTKVELGLDIGCGTGHSSIALSQFCKHVVGIDPSPDMITAAISHPQVEYQLMEDRELEFKHDQFDLITFAGSLYYAKSQELFDEVVRVSKNDSKVVVYDFELDLDQTLVDLGIDPVPNSESLYNHQENFEGLDNRGLQVAMESNDELSINVESTDLAHLLLSSRDNYTLLRRKFGEQNLFELLSSQLIQNSARERYTLVAHIYYTVYR